MGTTATTSLLLLSLLVAGAVAWPWHNTYQAMVMESAARTTSTIGLPSTVITKGFKCDSISAKIKNYNGNAVVHLCQTGSSVCYSTSLPPCCSSKSFLVGGSSMLIQGKAYTVNFLSSLSGSKSSICAYVPEADFCLSSAFASGSCTPRCAPEKPLCQENAVLDSPECDFRSCPCKAGWGQPDCCKCNVTGYFKTGDKCLPFCRQNCPNGQVRVEDGEIKGCAGDGSCLKGLQGPDCCECPPGKVLIDDKYCCAAGQKLVNGVCCDSDQIVVDGKCTSTCSPKNTISCSDTACTCKTGYAPPTCCECFFSKTSAKDVFYKDGDQCKRICTENADTGKCSGENGCSECANNFLPKDCCECPPDREKVGGVCVCKSPTVEVGGECVPCQSPMKYNEATRSCECPPKTRLVGGVCKCINDDQQLEGTQCKCKPPKTLEENGVCKCPPPTVEMGGKCVPCQSPMKYNEATRSCECPPKTRLVGGVCKCINDDQQLEGTQCKCKPPKTLEENGVCKCPPPKTLEVNGVCKCPPPTKFNEETGECQTQCQPPKFLLNGKCVECGDKRDVFFIIDSSSQLSIDSIVFIQYLIQRISLAIKNGSTTTRVGFLHGGIENDPGDYVISYPSSNCDNTLRNIESYLSYQYRWNSNVGSHYLDALKNLTQFIEKGRSAVVITIVGSYTPYHESVVQDTLQKLKNQGNNLVDFYSFYFKDFLTVQPSPTKNSEIVAMAKMLADNKDSHVIQGTSEKGFLTNLTEFFLGKGLVCKSSEGWAKQFIAINDSLGSPDGLSEYMRYSTATATVATPFGDITKNCITLKRTANEATQKKIVCDRNLLNQCATGAQISAEKNILEQEILKAVKNILHKEGIN